MTCVSNSGEIEVFEMRGRRAAFIYPACSKDSNPAPPPTSCSSSSPFLFIPSRILHGFILFEFLLLPLDPRPVLCVFIDRITDISVVVRSLSLPFRRFYSTLSAQVVPADAPPLSHYSLSFSLSSVNFAFHGTGNESCQTIFENFSCQLTVRIVSR